jgi:tetratricopeptide (TPR) repeat protein
MTVAATSTTAAAPLAPPGGWLFGRWLDLLFGCGLAYAAVFLGLVVVGRELRLTQPNLVFPLAFLAVSIPHYGATLLRVYERARDRRAYALFSIWITLALAAAFLGALFVPALGTFLVTLYFTWSPWHYTGQNYGLAVMFLRRRGVAIEGGEKRWLYASFVLSFLLVAVVSHSAGVGVRASAAYGGGDAIRFAPLGIPVALVSLLAPALCAAQLGALAVTFASLARRASTRALAPVLGLWLSQALWFTLPYACLQFNWLQGLDVLDWRNNNHYFMWIALAHAAQYMWVTAYYARQSGAQRSLPAFWLKAMAAGALVWTLPLLLFWKPGFAVLSPDEGMLVLVAAIANLHHFVLDGAIWKLRGPIARVLIQSQAEERDAVVARRPWLGRAAWALCAAALVANLAGVLLEDAWVRAVRERDLFAAREALADLFWVGRDRASYHLAVARGMLQVGAHDAALAEAREAAAESRGAEPHIVIAQASLAIGRPEDAARAFEAASALAPERAGLRRQAARAWKSAGRSELALPHLEAALQLAPDDESLARELARAREAAVTTTNAAP